MYIFIYEFLEEENVGVVKQVDTQDLKSCGLGREGSIPSPDTDYLLFLARFV
jgi:hypothetical protein